MAGLAFGTSRWDDIPSTLGMRVESGILVGQWNGLAVDAAFDNPYDQERETYYHTTLVKVHLDPPTFLGGARDVRGLDSEHRKRILDETLMRQLEANVLGATQMSEFWIGPSTVSGTWWRHEGAVQRYRIAFDALTHVARTVLARRAADPAPWERAVHENWPAVASAWGFSVDAPRYQLSAKVHGRDVLVCPSIESDPLNPKTDFFTTKVAIRVGLPQGAELSLTRQNDGFFRRIFRGQDVILGDEAFDAAFIVKGEPESFVRATLGPTVRAHLNALRTSGYEVTLHDGVLAVFAPSFAGKAEQLDELLKRAFSAATAFVSS